MRIAECYVGVLLLFIFTVACCLAQGCHAIGSVLFVVAINSVGPST